MIITCKEDFEKLPQDIKNDLMNRYHDGYYWDLEENMEFYEDEEYSFVEYESMITWSVDIYRSGTHVVPKLDIDLPSALCAWYHELWGAEERTKEQGIEIPEYTILKNHYWMIYELCRGYTVRSDKDGINVMDVDWFDKIWSSNKMNEFIKSFITFIEITVDEWISNVESYLSSSYEDCFSEERIIDNLIINEHEVEYYED